MNEKRTWTLPVYLACVTMAFVFVHAALAPPPVVPPSYSRFRQLVDEGHVATPSSSGLDPENRFTPLFPLGHPDPSSVTEVATG